MNPVENDGELVEMPFLRKGCLICVSPDDLVSLSTRVMEARVESLTMWESKQPMGSSPDASVQASKRRSLRISVGDTVQFCLKIPQKAGTTISTTAPRRLLSMGVITRLTFATNNQECRTVGQKMARITYFGGEETDEITHSVSPGRIIAVISHAPEMHPELVPRVKSFFEKNDNCYRDCFMEWDTWTSQERAEYCARCTAGEMVAAAGITSPTDDQVRALLERARAVVRTARTNVEAINLSRGSGDEPVARRRRQSRANEPRHFGFTQTPTPLTNPLGNVTLNPMTNVTPNPMTTVAPTQQSYAPQDMNMSMNMEINVMDPMGVSQQPPPQQQQSVEDLRRRKTGEGTSVSASGAVQGGKSPDEMLLKQLEEYREENARLHDELARKERDLRAEADRRVEEVRASLSSEIERLSAQLKALSQRSSFS